MSTRRLKREQRRRRNLNERLARKAEEDAKLERLERALLGDAAIIETTPIRAQPLRNEQLAKKLSNLLNKRLERRTKHR